MIRRIILALFVLFFLGAIGAGAILTWGYYYITRDLPPLFEADDYKPAAVTKVYSNDGTVIGEFYRERRYPVKINDVPKVVKQAFIAAEDASFYSHKGLDFVSILRAFLKNLQSGEASQGASTITQQVVKNILLTPEKKITRKIKEAILSYRIESELTKDEILEIYLNQIFFGNTAYGIKAAAELYFKKELSQVTLAEAAMLAGLPKAPSRFSPITNMPRAKQRQRYVLDQMVDAGLISRKEAEAASHEEIKVYAATAQNFFDAPYFVAETRRVLQEKFPTLDIDADGLQVFTTLDVYANRLATQALRKGLRSVDRRRGYRGPIDRIENADSATFRKKYGAYLPKDLSDVDVFPALIVGIQKQKNLISVDLGGRTGIINTKDSGWAKRRLTKDERTYSATLEDSLKSGDVIEVSLADDHDSKDPVIKLTLQQTPELEGAATLINPHSGDVIAMVGGYSYARNQFNRVTQSLRQPGSSFKPIVYLAAVDGFNYTPTTIVDDSPRTFKVGDTIWSPGNFDEKYLGPITLRTALEKSRNLVSVDIVSRIGLTPVIKYATLLGIESPIGRNLSLALGSSEVTMQELVRAYGVFPANGILFPTTLIQKVFDRTGKEIYSAEAEKYAKARQVIPPESAFIMSYMMKGVIQNGTATSIKSINRPAAGKTGTTNDFMDVWFIGFTPNYAGGVWVGFDQKKKIGEKETGGRISAPIWLDFMKPFLEYQDKKSYDQLVKESQEEATRLGIEYIPPDPIQPSDFRVPEGVEPFWIDKDSGYQSSEGSPGAILEYFKKGTKPREHIPEEMATMDEYLEGEEF